MLTDNKKKIDWHEEYQEKWLSLDGESLVADPKKLEDWIEALCESIRAEALKEVGVWAIKERDEALKELKIKPKTELRRAINMSEFGRFQAFRDVLAKLSKGGTQK